MFVRKRDEFLRVLRERVAGAVVHVNALAPPRFGTFRIWSFPQAHFSRSANNNNSSSSSNDDDELQLRKHRDWVFLVGLEPPFEALCKLQISTVVEAIERSFNKQSRPEVAAPPSSAENLPAMAENARPTKLRMQRPAWCGLRSGGALLSAAIGVCAVILMALLLALQHGQE